MVVTKEYLQFFNENFEPEFLEFTFSVLSAFKRA